MVLKLVLVLLALVEYVNSSTCSSRSFHINDGVKNRALETRTFKTSTIQEYPAECFIECSRDCRCLSFNICGKQCQLNADTNATRANSLKIKPGCSYYDLPEAQPTSFPRCCLTPNPCQNGGTCSSASGLKNKRRFSCLCRSGYYGALCVTRMPRSCGDFLTESVKPSSGEYVIIDDTGKPYTVYCDFDSEPGFAWTMVVSFSRDNSPSVQNQGLLEDRPVNKDTLNWESYRLSLSRMNSLRERSTHWRATCGFDMNGVDFQEYIRVNLSVVDFPVYYYNGNSGPAACQTIEYMNILGSECHNCNFGLFARQNVLPHLALGASKTWGYCTFELSSKQHYCGSIDAWSFAVKAGCYDPRSRCQMVASSTTQNWCGEGPIISN